MRRALVAVAALALLASAVARAATVYRCGNEYTDVACPAAQTVVVASAVSAEQRAEAREVARREKTLAAEMTRDRREQEALARPARAGSLSPPRPAASANTATTKKHARKHGNNAAPDDERDFVAAVPKSKKAGK